MLVYWIMAIASGPDAYNTIRSFFGSVIGKLLLLGWSYALFYHLCNGIRHLFWDIGMGFEMRTVYISGWAVVVASLVLTLSAWLIGYAMADNV